MIELTWEQVRRFRLRRSGLTGGWHDLVEAARRVCGVHAQVMSSAELALAARVEALDVRDVRDALWRDKRLVKTWAMRGTLHLLPAADLPLWAGALRTRGFLFRTPGWLRYFGIRREELEQLFAAVGASLHGRAMTREEIADEVGRVAGERARRALASGWGSLLKPVAMEGRLVFGPSRGRNVVFVDPHDWVGPFEPLAERDAMRETVRRWIAAYGPGTHEELASWWGTGQRRAREAFDQLADELVAVAVDGHRAWALARDAAELEDADVSGPARLVPGFDAYVVGFQPRHAFVDAKFRASIWRTAGWISPVVLVDGRAAGVWHHSVRHGTMAIRVEPFGRLATARRRELEADAERLARALHASPSVSFA